MQAGVESNPTKDIVLGAEFEALLSKLPISYKGSKVEIVRVELPVSASGVRRSMDNIFEDHINPIVGTRSRAVVVHCGVDGSMNKDSAAFKLERRGYNCCDFRVADNEGFMPSNEAIDERQGLGFFWGSM